MLFVFFSAVFSPYTEARLTDAYLLLGPSLREMALYLRSWLCSPALFCSLFLGPTHTPSLLIFLLALDEAYLAHITVSYWRKIVDSLLPVFDTLNKDVLSLDVRASRILMVHKIFISPPQISKEDIVWISFSRMISCIVILSVFVDFFLFFLSLLCFTPMCLLVLQL
jgi:hypothetical protein